jgi:hypothetical protein
MTKVLKLATQVNVLRVLLLDMRKRTLKNKKEKRKKK